MQWQEIPGIRNITTEGPRFHATLLNVFRIPKTVLHNLANTWKRQVTPLSWVVTFSTNQWGCQRKRKIRASKKRRLRVSPSMYLVERTLQSQKTWALVPILILARKLLGLISPSAKQRYGTNWTTFWHQNTVILKFKNTGSWIDIFPKNTYRWPGTWRSAQHH